MFARTKRLMLRPAWPEEAPALAAAIGHRAVTKWLSRVPWPYRVEDATAFITAERGPTQPAFLIVAHDEAAPRIVGGIGLQLDGDGHELGYWLTPPAWGRGYATEAGRAVIDLVRHALPIDRLHARHHVENAASARVLARLGFRSTGVIEQTWSSSHGAAVPAAIMTLDLARPKPMSIAA